jgi:hypothetical protein
MIKISLKKLLNSELIILWCKNCRKFKVYLAPYWYGYSICEKCYDFNIKIL